MLDAKRERFMAYDEAIKLPTTDERDLPSKREEQKRAQRSEVRKRQEAVPGLLNPHVRQDDMDM